MECLPELPAGHKWAGMLKEGIDIIDPWQSRFQKMIYQPSDSNSLVNNFVPCFYEEPDKSLFTGTDRGGIGLSLSICSAVHSFRYGLIGLDQLIISALCINSVGYCIT